MEMNQRGDATMLHWMYIAIALGIAALVGIELFQERRWREQMALAVVLLPLVLRILHIK
jgi:hypothetical protein